MIALGGIYRVSYSSTELCYGDTVPPGTPCNGTILFSKKHPLSPLSPLIPPIPTNQKSVT